MLLIVLSPLSWPAHGISVSVESIHYDIGGLDDPMLGSKPQFPVCISGIFCQTVHDGSAHCVAISTLYGKDDGVDIYDTGSSDASDIYSNV